MDTARHDDLGVSRRRGMRLPRPWVMAAWISAAVVMVGMIGG